jgi:hypothetical protein
MSGKSPATIVRLDWSRHSALHWQSESSRKTTTAEGSRALGATESPSSDESFVETTRRLDLTVAIDRYHYHPHPHP